MEKKFFLTKEGFEKIKKEYQDLKKLKLLKSQEGTPVVLHSEDLDPEYLSFKEDLSFLESRLSELEYVLKNIELIKSPPKEKRNIVNLGAQVTVEIDGKTDEFEIVGPLEANPFLGKISNESPVGSSLLGHQAGDEVLISSPTKIIYKIKKIKYKLS